MKILTLQETADHIGVHVQTIKKHIYITKTIAHLVQYLGRSPGFTEDALPEIKRLILRDAPAAGQGGGTKYEAARRQERAVALHEAGKSYSQIAKELGFKDASGAQKSVKRALAKKNPAKKKPAYSLKKR